MAINPPSDIVLDVARAADPLKLQAAALKLTGAADGDDFANVVDELGSSKPAAVSAQPLPDLHVAIGASGQQLSGTPAMSSPAMKPYRDFEAFVLQSFVQSMLPKESEDVFGKGTAGEMWKALLAEQLGKQIARAGGIGIARQIYKSHPGGLSSLPGRHAAGADPLVEPNGIAPMSWRRASAPPLIDHRAAELAPHDGAAKSEAATTVKRTL